MTTNDTRRIILWSSPKTKGISVRLPGGEVLVHRTDREVVRIIEQWLQDQRRPA